jgi:hypothetical protein
VGERIRKEERVSKVAENRKDLGLIVLASQDKE